MRIPKNKKWLPEEFWFWDRVTKFGQQIPYVEGVCWEWDRWLGADGYGKIRRTKAADQRKYAILSAHRVSWEFTHGPIPFGKLILHHCDNRSCVRPAHLFMGDDKANSDDKIKKGRGKWTKGAEQHLAKLTEERVIELRKERAQKPPTPLKELAERYGVSLVAVSWAATGKTWKHVTQPSVPSIPRGSRQNAKGRFTS